MSFLRNMFVNVHDLLKFKYIFFNNFTKTEKYIQHIYITKIKLISMNTV